MTDRTQSRATADSLPDNASHFIAAIIADDVKAGRVKQVVTRFPPEPNGYLHIGHARAIVLNFGVADQFGGRTNLRFDDTNPVKEDAEFVQAIQADVAWLGYSWDGLFFASDYFDEMYERAVLLIRKGLAYVDDQTADEIRDMRGTLTEPGKDSPHRGRSVEENLALFAGMKAGRYPNGTRVLRAKIDMTSPNINMRDPVIYRIVHASHHNTGDAWCIYPTYTYAHPMEDAIEGVTHSLCTLEFEDQRPFYDWVIRECEMPHVSRQYEFGRLNLTNSVMSKRKLKLLVDEGVVDGWDDPRMPTLSGLRRRGYTPESIRAFVDGAGISRTSGAIDIRTLEHYIREDLKLKAPRTMAVLDPLKVVIANYPEGRIEWLDAENNAENPEMGMRQVPFSREIYIEREDFMESPPPKYHRLYPGNEVRLKHAYFIRCEEVVKDAAGRVIELRCTYDPETKSGTGFTGRKVKGTIHWVEASRAVPAEFRLYEPLIFDGDDADEEAAEGGERGRTDDGEASPDVAASTGAGAEQGDFAGGEAEQERLAGSAGADRSFLERINPNSLVVARGFVEPDMRDAEPQSKFQFFRHGYFNVDPKASAPGQPVFNRIVSLKSSFEV